MREGGASSLPNTRAYTYTCTHKATTSSRLCLSHSPSLLEPLHKHLLLYILKTKQEAMSFPQPIAFHSLCFSMIMCNCFVLFHILLTVYFDIVTTVHRPEMAAHILISDFNLELQFCKVRHSCTNKTCHTDYCLLLI